MYDTNETINKCSYFSTWQGFNILFLSSAQILSIFFLGCYENLGVYLSSVFDDQGITFLLLMMQTLYNSAISVVYYSLVQQLIDYPSNYVVGICTFIRRIYSPPKLPICLSKSPERACENILFFNSICNDCDRSFYHNVLWLLSHCIIRQLLCQVK